MSQWSSIIVRDRTTQQIVSRGATVKELKDSMWLHGPQCLTRTDLWPVEHLTSTGTVEEVRVQAVLTTPDEQKWWTRLSRWTRVVGMVAQILSWKYRHEMKRKIRQRAEQIHFKIIQRECFPQELTSLMANRRVPKRPPDCYNSDRAWMTTVSSELIEYCSSQI